MEKAKIRKSIFPGRDDHKQLMNDVTAWTGTKHPIRPTNQPASTSKETNRPCFKAFFSVAFPPETHKNGLKKCLIFVDLELPSPFSLITGKC
jgi:hypothetical protein